MKKAKQTLTAALAATLATGVVGSVASAAPIDDLYKAAYNAMVKAQTEKTQTAINEARVAINALPKELDSAKGTFSEAVDKVQQPIYTQIIALIEKGNKEAKQETVNEGRKLLVGVEEAYAKTWSSNFDTIQQTLVKNATDAVAAAAKSQKAEDITKAEALVTELKTADNADVKKAVEGLEKDLVEKLNVYVKEVKVVNGTTLEVVFSKEVKESTVKKDCFVVQKGSLKYFAKDAELQTDKKTVKVTLANALEDAKDYELVTRNIADVKGAIVKETKTAIKYEKTDVAKIEFVTTNTVKGADLRDQLKITNEKGVDITQELKLKKQIKITCDDKNAIKDGVVQSVARLKKEYTVKVTVGDKFLEEKVTVIESLANEIVDYTFADKAVDIDDYKDNKVTMNHNLRSYNHGSGDVRVLTVFYKDSLGNLKAAAGKEITKISSSDVKVVKPTVDNKLQALKEGRALLTVTIGVMEQTIEVEVTKDVVADAKIEIKNSNITVARSTVENYIPVDLVDNYSGDKKEDESFDVELWNESSEKWESTTKVTAKKGVITVVGSRLDSSKKARLTKNYKGLKLEQEFEIIVQDKEDTESFVIEALNDNNRALSKLDRNEDEVVDKQLTVVVYGIDSNGNKVEVMQPSKYVVKEGNNDENLKLTAGKFIAAEQEVGTYDISAEVNFKGDKKKTENTVTVSVVNDEVARVKDDVVSTTGSLKVEDIALQYEGDDCKVLEMYAVDSKGKKIDSPITSSKTVTLKWAKIQVGSNDPVVVELDDASVEVTIK